jgi:hypothetical protein
LLEAVVELADAHLDDAAATQVRLCTPPFGGHNT